MRPELAAPFKAQLLAKRLSLLEQLASLRGGAAGRAEASAAHFSRPEDSSAQLSTQRELEFALDARESAELNQVQAALDRVEAGTYGLCIDCGSKIALARLQATPEAGRCMACQTMTEQP
jgi:DnaK suppressor protein